MNYLRSIVVLAVVAALMLGSAGAVFAKGPPEEHPGKGPQWQGKKHGFFGNVTAVTEVDDGNVTIALDTEQGWTVTLRLPDEAKYKAPSVTRGWVDLDTFIDDLGGNVTALEGRRVAVLAVNVVEEPQGVFDAEANKLTVVPDPRARVRQHAHRTGIVAQFEDGVSITIVDVLGESHDFTLGGNETVYHPEGKGAGDIVVDESFVTVVSTGDPKLNPPAKAIVVHPQIPEGWLVERP